MTEATKKTATKAAKKVEDVANDNAIAQSAREFVKRTADTAKERTDAAYEGTAKFNANLETALTRMAGSYVSFLSGVADMAYRNANHTIDTAHKLAAARSISEATQIQADFVRETTQANFDQLRTAFEGAREMVGEATETVRDEASKAWNGVKKAA